MSPTPADFWTRQRGAYTDEIFVHWSRHGAPRFAIRGSTDQPGRGGPRHGYVIAHPGVLKGVVWSDLFGGWLRFTRPTVRRATKRMVELIDYLETGEKSYHIDW